MSNDENKATTTARQSQKTTPLATVATPVQAAAVAASVIAKVVVKASAQPNTISETQNLGELLNQSL